MKESKKIMPVRILFLIILFIISANNPSLCIGSSGKVAQNGATITTNLSEDRSSYNDNSLEPACSDISIIIYQNGIALIRDKREIKLLKGVNHVLFDDINPGFVVNSVFLNLTDFSKCSIIEYNFLNQGLNKSELLSKSIGKEVFVTKFINNSINTSKSILMHYDYKRQEATVKIANRIYIVPICDIAFDEKAIKNPSNAAFRVLLNSDIDQTITLELCYLAYGFEWHPSYKANVSCDLLHTIFNAYAQIQNKNEWPIKNANLVLSTSTPFLDSGQTNESSQHAFSHKYETTYSHPTPINIDRNSFKVIQIKSVQVKNPRKGYLLVVPQDILYSPNSGEHSLSVKNVLIMKNNEFTGLNLNLPEGKAQVFVSNKGLPSFIGEQVVGPLRINESIPIVVGTEKRIVAKAFQTEFKKISEKTIEIGGRIILTNSINEDITVRIVCDTSEQHWSINRESEKHLPHHVSRPTWDLIVPQNSEVALRIRLTLDSKERQSKK